MIITDTSVWIDSFRGNFATFKELRLLYDSDQLLISGPVIAELLQGAKTKKEAELIIELWKNIPRAPRDQSWFETGLNSFENKWRSKGIGIIDAYLISLAWKNNYKIWTLDKKLIKAAGTNFIYSQN